MLNLKERYNWKRYQISLLCIVLILGVISVVTLYNVQEEGSNMALKQAIGLSIGLFGAFVLSLIDYHWICKFAPLMYLVNLALLIIVKFVDGLRLSRGGAVRWIGIKRGGRVLFEFQPSELTKMIMVLFIAWFLHVTRSKLTKKDDLKHGFTMNPWLQFFLVVMLMAIPTFLVFLQPDLSTTLVLLVAFATIILASEISFKILFPVIAVAIPVVLALFWYVQQDFQKLLTDSQQLRILSLLNPDAYSDAIYQQENSVTAIASGGLIGKLLGNPNAVRGSDSIPVIESDFIFSAIAEELGFVGACAVIICITALCFSCFSIAKRSQDYLGKLIAIGIGATYMFQSFVNIGVVTMLLPNTGIPLPFLSYGLSSLLSSMIGIGIVLNIGISKQKQRG